MWKNKNKQKIVQEIWVTLPFTVQLPMFILCTYFINYNYWVKTILTQTYPCSMYLPYISQYFLGKYTVSTVL